MKQLAWEQDCIGWRHFTEGKICKGIRTRQEMHLRRRRTNLTADSWTKGFVERLLAMNHKQWIFRCTTKHHRTKGTKVLANQRDVLREIERQLARGVGFLAPEDQWLLEIDRKELLGNSLKHQQHWLWSIEAAREAGARAERISKGKTTSWKEILNDENYAHLPTTAPKEDAAAMAPPTRSTAQPTKPAAAPTEATRAKATGAKKAKILTTFFPNAPAELVAAYGSLAPQVGRGKVKSAAKKKQAEVAAAYGSLARPRPRRQVPSQEALAADRIGIFTAASTFNNTIRQRLNNALTPPPIRRTVTGAIIEAPTFISRRDVRGGANLMTQAEFATLRNNTWLTDAVLTFFLKTFVHDEAKGVHCLSSGFFKLIAHRNGGVYNYEESVENVVRNQFNGYEEGFASVKQLLTPINISDQHWIFLRVKMEAK